MPVTMSLRVAIALLAPLAAGGAEPQGGSEGLALRSHTIDGGGGVSSGGGYRIVGSLAQPDAEPLHPASGARFTLIGGFLAAAQGGPLGADIFSDGFED